MLRKIDSLLGVATSDAIAANNLAIMAETWHQMAGSARVGAIYFQGSAHVTESGIAARVSDGICEYTQDAGVRTGRQAGLESLRKVIFDGGSGNAHRGVSLLGNDDDLDEFLRCGAQGRAAI